MPPSLPAQDLTIHPAPTLRGRLRVPGDKSMSHRYAVLGALAHGITVIRGLAPGADVRSTLACLRSLGVAIAADGGEVRLTGRGREALVEPAAPLDAGNSGTTLRLLSGVVAACPFRTVLTGDESLRRRPMARVIDPLQAMGATVTAAGSCPPLEVVGGPLTGIDWRPAVPSAQVKSAILLAGLAASGTTRVREPLATRDHTERAFPLFGLGLETAPGQVTVAGGQRPLAPADPLLVPGDPSSAAVWAAAAAARPGSSVRLDGVCLNPHRLGFVRALERMGAGVTVEPERDVGGEPVGTLEVRYGPRQATTIGADEVPALIDELPVLAASAALGGHLEVTGASELRVKESDRITALVTGLRALGVQATERPDGFVIDGGRPPSGGRADAALDHRLVLAFAVVGLGATGPTHIGGAGAVAVSYPGFAADLAALVR